MLVDGFARPIDYLRVSVTDQCDLRCLYCRPAAMPLARPLPGILSNDEIAAVVRAAAALGVRKVRLTGGEPLLRDGIVALTESLAAIPGVRDLSLTTNGLHLEQMAAGLAAAGLRRVNVSLDTLRADRFRRITGAPGLTRVLNGIRAAHDAGLRPVKINTVVMRGVNDDEITDFASLTEREGWHVRFIEIMPIGQNTETLLVTAAEMRQRLPGLAAADGVVGYGPARIYRMPGAGGTISIISPVSEHFCEGCNRLRLTADGKLRPCLLNDGEVDLLPTLRDGSAPFELQRLILQAVANKPEKHELSCGCVPHGRTMTQIGG